MTNQATRIIVKAAGDLAANAIAAVDDADSALDEAAEATEGEKSLANEAEATEGSGIGEAVVDIDTYKPTILPSRAWKLSETDLGTCFIAVSHSETVGLHALPISEWIAEGCAVLGTGGGGSSYPAFLMSRQALREGKQILVSGYRGGYRLKKE